MAKLIKDWNDLAGLETEHYRVVIDDDGRGWVVPNLPDYEDIVFFAHHYEAQKMHNNTCQEFVKLLQKYRFDVVFEE